MTIDIPADIAERAEILCDQFRHIEDDREFVARILMEVGKGAPAGVTNEQAKILNFIRDYQSTHGGASPSQDEIGKHVGRSKGNVNGYLQRLKARGIVNMQPNRARSITLVGRA